ncbi:MAG: hypothetical protein ACTHLZ_19045 [Tepidisphaeraceae bacterium]
MNFFAMILLLRSRADDRDSLFIGPMAGRLKRGRPIHQSSLEAEPMRRDAGAIRLAATGLSAAIAGAASGFIPRAVRRTASAATRVAEAGR